MTTLDRLVIPSVGGLRRLFGGLLSQGIHEIDCDSEVNLPAGCKLVEDSLQLPNRTQGRVRFRISRFGLFRSDLQEGDDANVTGFRILPGLESRPVLTAHFASFFLHNQDLVPSSWNGKCICFWGTRFFHMAERVDCIRAIKQYDGGGQWYERHILLRHPLGQGARAAILKVA